MNARPLPLLAPTILAALLAGGCGGGGFTAQNRPASAWTERNAALFDDTIEPSAAGLEAEPKDLGTDKTFRERAQSADAVVRVKAETISQSGEGAAESFRVTLAPKETLAGKAPPTEAFSLVIPRTNPSFGIVKHLDARLVGKTFIAFVQGYAGEDGARVYHAHLSGDTKGVAQAVSDAYALGELGK